MVYNDAGSDWNMSYVYASKFIKNLPLEEAEQLIKNTNTAIENERPQSRWPLGDFGIYALNDVLEIVNQNTGKLDNEKEGKLIKNYVTHAEESIVVFDDVGTRPLLANLSIPNVSGVNSNLWQPSNVENYTDVDEQKEKASTFNVG